MKYIFLALVLHHRCVAALYVPCGDMKNASLLTAVDFDLKCTLYYDKRLPLQCANVSSKTTYGFELREQLAQNENSTEFCVGLIHLYVDEKLADLDGARNYNFSFKFSFPVGTIETDETSSIKPWTIKTLNLLTGIANLPALRSSPDDAKFWNFSSVYWRVDNNWFLGLQTDGYSFKWKNFLALNNTSASDLRFVFHNYTPQFEETTFTQENQNQIYLPLLKNLMIKNDSLSNPLSIYFKGFENIQTLDLSQNNLYEVPKSMSALQNLRILDLSSNNMISFSKRSPFPEVITSFQRLATLNLSQTKIKNISVVFPYLKKLRMLNLSFCAIENIVDDAFNNTPSLISLDLSHNLLRYIKITFPEKLQLLLLQHNKIHSLEAYSVSVLQVETLNLESNELKSWPRLRGLYLLHYDVTSNKLTDIVKYKGIVVKKLKLRENLVANWSDPRAFSWVTKELNISKNHIAVVTENMKRSMQHLVKLDIAENPFDCSDCRIKIMQALLNLSQPLQRRQPSCGGPDYQRGRLVRDAVCVEPPQDYWLAVGAPTGSVLVLGVVVAAVLFVYRSEIAYSCHLYKVRRCTGQSKSEPPGALYDAFVCYGSSERMFVLRELAPLLERGGERYRLCLHDRDFLLGSQIARNIVNAIDRSRRTILVLSPHFINSKWCQWELDMANHKMFEDSRNFLILLEREPLDRSKLPRHLKYLMDTRTYLEWHRGDDATQQKQTKKQHAMRRLRQALGRSLYMRRQMEDDGAGGERRQRMGEEEDEGNDANERTPLMAEVAHRI